MRAADRRCSADGFWRQSSLAHLAVAALDSVRARVRPRAHDPVEHPVQEGVRLSHCKRQRPGDPNPPPSPIRRSVPSQRRARAVSDGDFHYIVEVSRLEQFRGEADYNRFFTFTEDGAREEVDVAISFCDRPRRFLDEHGWRMES